VKKFDRNYFVAMHPVPNEFDPLKNPQYIIFDKTAELNDYTMQLASRLSELSFFDRVFRYKRTVEKLKIQCETTK